MFVSDSNSMIYHTLGVVVKGRVGGWVGTTTNPSMCYVLTFCLLDVHIFVLCSVSLFFGLSSVLSFRALCVFMSLNRAMCCV